MKMLLVVYEECFDGSVTDAFKEAGVRTYMKFHDATGKDASAQVCPGIIHRGSEDKISSLMMPVPDEEIPHLLEIVRGLKTQRPMVGIRAFTFPLEEIV